MFQSWLGRRITETDNIWFTCLTLNTNQVHFNNEFASGTPFGRALVNSTFTLALVTGMSVPDTSENATANLSWTDIKLPEPVYVGDTLWSVRTFMVYKRAAPEVSDLFPGTDTDWTV